MTLHTPLNISFTPIIRHLGTNNQALISSYLDRGLYSEAKKLQQIDQHLRWLIMQCKMIDGDSSHYVWHTVDDNRVRESHARNNNRIFRWDNAPDTGHPGEDFGCRCWAEPLTGSQYASQMLISEVNDNSKRWDTSYFAHHYFFGNGINKNLEEIGYLGDVIEHYSETLGIYSRVNQQIINEAKTTGSGKFTYDFSNSYEFGSVAFELAESTVSGQFLGEVRKENSFLVISGIVTYNFLDNFADPLQIIEAIDGIPTIDREDAIILLEQVFGINVDFSGTPFLITGSWRTKFNATINTRKQKNTYTHVR